MAMEIMDEHERYIKNPFRCIRALAELALTKVDDNLFEFPSFEQGDYPTVSNVERPAASEEDLLQGRLW